MLLAQSRVVAYLRSTKWVLRYLDTAHDLSSIQKKNLGSTQNCCKYKKEIEVLEKDQNLFFPTLLQQPHSTKKREKEFD